MAAGLPQQPGAAKVKAQQDAKEEEKKAAGLKRKADKEAQDEASKEARWGGVGGECVLWPFLSKTGWATAGCRKPAADGVQMNRTRREKHLAPSPSLLPERQMGVQHTTSRRVLTHPRGPTPVKMKKKGKKKGGTPVKQAAAA